MDMTPTQKAQMDKKERIETRELKQKSFMAQVNTLKIALSRKSIPSEFIFDCIKDDENLVKVFNRLTQ